MDLVLPTQIYVKTSKLDVDLNLLAQMVHVVKNGMIVHNQMAVK
jgi:hypothetical protein